MEMQTMKVGRSKRTPSSACISCGAVSDAAAPVGGDTKPSPGDITVCLYCGHVMAFDENLNFRSLTNDEMREIAGDERIVAINRARSKL
jgi:hypothetical protein